MVSATENRMEIANMETRSYKTGDAEIIAKNNCPSVRNISIELWRAEKLIGTTLIALGAQSADVSAATVEALRKAGKDPATRREFAGRPGIVLPAEIALDIDELSRKAKTGVDNVDALHAQQLAGIDGLSELQGAINAWMQYGAALEVMMDDEYNDGVCPPRKPAVSITALRAKYPRAAAYIDAQTYADADHYAKAAAGRTAMQAILAGEDYTAAMATMQASWSAHCDAHVWD